MTVPDPLEPFSGGPLHRLDINIAEGMTGVHGRSISRHAVQPFVRRGADPHNAVAILHWVLIGAMGAILIKALGPKGS